MLRFAGNLSGSVFSEQLFLGGDWFGYRTRGAAELPRDAGFAPHLKNEEETEYQLTYARQLTPRVDLLAEAWYREDHHLIEDYDPDVYFDPTVAGDLALTPATFGYPPSGPGSVNYFLANLVSGKREARGIDLAIDRHLAGPWQASFQYSWKDAEGNSNSDGAADLQGDFLVLDPRQPWMWGDLPGTIEHQVKAFGSYRLPFGLEVGGLVYWNSGAVFTEADIVRPTTHTIYYNHRREDGTYVGTGEQRHSGYATLDLRLRYFRQLAADWGLDLFLDVFNALDNQDPLRITEAHNNPDFSYREPRLLLEPRRYQVGVRVSFR
jgi:hypothetical protein